MVEKEHPDFLWLDGQIIPWDEATVHITALEWGAIASVYEGLRAYRHPRTGTLYLFRVDDHLARFADSMKMMRMDPAFSPQDLKEAILALLLANKINDDAYIRPFAFFEKVHLFYPSPKMAATHILITARPLGSHLKIGHKVRCRISSWTRISDNVMPPRAKAVANYQNSWLATTEAGLDGYDSAILLNERGKVSEGPGACLMLVRQEKVITPPVTSGILESITRLTLIKLLSEILGMEVVEREVDRTELYVAQEAFFCGTGEEITPIVSVDRLPVGDGEVGPLTKKVIDLYHDLVRGIDERYPEWRTPV